MLTVIPNSKLCRDTINILQTNSYKMHSNSEQESLLKNDFLYPEILESLVQTYQSRKKCEDIDFIQNNGGCLLSTIN